MLALRIVDLEKIYTNGFHALRGINLEVMQGGFHGLLGPNGAGKSTIIGIISSLIKKTAGRVEVFGYDIDKDLLEVKRKIGLVPQEFNFNQFESVIEILINQAGYYGISKKESYERTEEVLKQFDLWEKRLTMARNLSGGMKRRLLIARAMVYDPKLLILDEPTAGVDIEIRHFMWEFLRKINSNSGVTIILTTHYLEEAENLCKHITILNKGLITKQSPVHTLINKLKEEQLILNFTNPLDDSVKFPGYQTILLDPYTMKVTLPRGQGLTALFCQLAEHKIDVISLRNRQNRLEQLFLELTAN